MLVLTRKQQEKIQIGDDIVITILKTKGKTVRIGIEAPSTTPVLRGELAVRIREEAATAAASQPASRPAPELVSESKAGDKANPRPAEKPDTDGPGADQTPGADSRWDTGDGSPRVSLERVPRSRVATVLTEKLGGPMPAKAGPLRAMLDRRAGAAL